MEDHEEFILGDWVRAYVQWVILVFSMLVLLMFVYLSSQIGGLEEQVDDLQRQLFATDRRLKCVQDAVQWNIYPTCR